MEYASTERVVTAWLSSLPGITAAMVDTQLPNPNLNSTWAASGFITPHALGGTGDVHMQIDHPVVELKCWAVDPDTGRPPWNMAGNLAQTIKNGCFASGTSQFLTLPYCDQNARLMSAYVIALPRRAFGDMGDYACFTTSVELHWVAR
jgi:hypothetical protein